MQTQDPNQRKSPWIIAALVAIIAAIVALIARLLKGIGGDGRKAVVKEYPEARLTVIVPVQTGRSAPVSIADRYMPPDILERRAIDPVNNPDDFIPTEALVNFEVVEAENIGRVVSQFDPPIRLEFRYTLAQLEAAQKDPETYYKATAHIKPDVNQRTDTPRPLFGYWNEKKWVLFDARYPDPLLQADGVAVVELGQWIDPPTAGWPR